MKTGIGEDGTSWRLLGYSLLLTVLVLLLGTAGFYFLGGARGWFEALYLTVMIVTTVGLKEQYPEFNTAETRWSLVVMLLGIVTVLYATGNLVAFLISGELNRILGRRQLEGKIQKLNKHFIVCGFGRMGRALCDSLESKGAPFVVIERDPQRIPVALDRGYLHITGDATLENTLETAQIKKARGLASCLRGDADNVLVVLSARGLNEKMTITARAENEETEEKLLRAGASRVICPPLLGATRIMQMMLLPAVDELMDVVVSGGGLEISKVKASELPRAVGQTLQELKIPSKTGLSVILVVRSDGERRLNPPPTLRLRKDDELLVVGPPDGVELLMSELGAH